VKLPRDRQVGSLGFNGTFSTNRLYHYHRRVACPSVSIAISTNWRRFERSCACIHAVLRPRLWDRRSSSIVWSHVRLGRPARCRQSAGGRMMVARRMREWSCDGSALARCPNRRSRLFAITEVTGGWPVLRLTSSLVICAVYGICTTFVCLSKRFTSDR